MKKLFIVLVVFLVFITYSSGAEESPGEEYIIKKNDTLWDISDSKLEDPFLWPKLWNVNPQIENPDLIFPGTKILIPSREELTRMPPFPAKRIPAALPSRAKEEPEPKHIFKMPERPVQRYIVDKNLYIASGWIADELSSVGKVIHIYGTHSIAGKGDIVYLELNEEVKSEKRFFTVKDVKIVKHPVTQKPLGHQIRVTGILEVIGMDNNTPKAKVKISFEEIEIGNWLLPYKEMEPPPIPEKIRTPKIQGYIVESHTNSYLSGKGDIVFLDKGYNDGLRVGDVFSVISELPVESAIGTLQIVSLQPSTSSAVVLKSTQEVSIGSKWGN
jgi:hypothetical protein